MATITEVREVCDVCPPDQGKRRKLRPYRVGEDGLLVRVLLCREHGKYLDELVRIGSVVQTTAPTVKVWTMEEIEERRNKKTPPSR